MADDGSIGDGYPKDITIWVGLPYGRIDAAINFKNSRTYFFSGGDYYRFNDRNFAVCVNRLDGTPSHPPFLM